MNIYKKPRNVIHPFSGIFIILFILSACQPTSDKINSALTKTQPNENCGKTQGSFLGSWFDYYERALSFADCEMWPESEQDLRAALNKRSQDKRRAYTIGMHFIDDYFPNRELGIALFHQRKYSEAEKYLKTSLSQFPTSKAEEYLKRVRSAQLNISQSDKQPPIIEIKTPLDNKIHSETTIDVKGLVKDDSFIDTLEVNGIPYRHIVDFKTDTGIPVRVERKVPEINFFINVPILYIDNQAVVEVIATDITGKRSRKVIPINIDQLGPQINVNKIERVDHGKIHVVLDVHDKNSALKYIQVNDQTFEVKAVKQKDKSGALTHDITIDEVVTGPFDQEHILVIAVDSAGNKTQAQLLTERQQEKSQSELNVFFHKHLNRSTFEKQVYIEGEIKSDSAISKLEINGNNILNGSTQHLFFNFLADLKLGENKFEVIVKSQTGQVNKKLLTITREEELYRSFAERLKVAHFPFPCNRVSRAPCRYSSGLFENLNTKLDSRKRFQITDRKMIYQLIDNTRGCDTVTDQCVLKISDQLIDKGIWQEDFANAILTGSVIERTNTRGQASVEIYGRMIDNKTRETLTSIDIYAENLNSELFSGLSNGLAIEIVDAFPLIDAEILNITDDTLSLDIFAQQDKVWQKMPLLVYQSDKQTPCANANLTEIRSDKILAAVDTQFCKTILPKSHRVITR